MNKIVDLNWVAKKRNDDFEGIDDKNLQILTIECTHYIGALFFKREVIWHVQRKLPFYFSHVKCTICKTGGPEETQIPI